MASPIEVAHINEEQRIVDLAGLSGSNQEPGFQVDGIVSQDQFLRLEELLTEGAPHMIPGGVFHDVYETTIGEELRGRAEAVTIQPHIDYNLQGFAAHHNLRDQTYPVSLAVCRNAATFRLGAGYRMYRTQIVEGTERNGLVVPKRITITSEGAADPYTKQTVHFHDRRKTDGVVRVNRYENSNPFTTDRRPEVIAALQAAFTVLKG